MFFLICRPLLLSDFCFRPTLNDKIALAKGGKGVRDPVAVPKGRVIRKLGFVPGSFMLI